MSLIPSGLDTCSLSPIWLPERSSQRTIAHLVAREYYSFYRKRIKWQYKLFKGEAPADIPITPKQYKNPIFEARKYAQILALPSIQTYTQVGAHFGVSRARVCQMMNLLKLPEKIVRYVENLGDSEELKCFTERKLRPVINASNQSAAFNELLPD